MEHFDIVVVGAGPAGSSAACYLARQGVRVALLDRSAFPRDKSCGDGLTVRAVRELEAQDLGDWLRGDGRRGASQMRISGPCGESLQIGAEGQIVVFAPRRELDDKLVSLAVEAGARLLPRVAATHLSYDDDRATVYGHRNGGDIALGASLVIVADGAAGAFSRNIGLHAARPSAVGLRSYLTGRDAAPQLIDVSFDRDVLPYYGWVFPTSDGMCNVGVCLPIGELARVDIRRPLERFVRDHPVVGPRLEGMRLIRPRGGYLRFGTEPYELVRERLLVVGEAAGLVSPLTGAGISAALRSGRMAAQHALAALAEGDFSRRRLLSYQRDIRRAFRHQFLIEKMVRRTLGREHSLRRMLRLGVSDPAIRAPMLDVFAERDLSLRRLFFRTLPHYLWPPDDAQGGASPQTPK